VHEENIQLGGVSIARAVLVYGAEEAADLGILFTQVLELSPVGGRKAVEFWEEDKLRVGLLPLRDCVGAVCLLRHDLLGHQAARVEPASEVWIVLINCDVEQARQLRVAVNTAPV
jgi:hypothetical protein